MPISFILVASSCRDCGSNSRRGWLGLASISSIAISLIVDEPCGRTSSVDIKASRPRPKELYFLCTAIIVNKKWKRHNKKESNHIKKPLMAFRYQSCLSYSVHNHHLWLFLCSFSNMLTDFSVYYFLG